MSAARDEMPASPCRIWLPVPPTRYRTLGLPSPTRDASVQISAQPLRLSDLRGGHACRDYVPGIPRTLGAPPCGQVQPSVRSDVVLGHTLATDKLQGQGELSVAMA